MGIVETMWGQYRDYGDDMGTMGNHRDNVMMMWTMWRQHGDVGMTGTMWRQCEDNMGPRDGMGTTSERASSSFLEL